MTVELLGYQYSVYSWIARLALHEKGVNYNWIEIDPFDQNVPINLNYLATHPFNRVPALRHDEFVVYETCAITQYIDEAFDGPSLQRVNLQERARSSQVISIVDSYAYWPLVRQVFSHAVFRPRMARSVDQNELRRGLDAAPRVLAALERIAGDAQYLCGDDLSLADIHLAPMIGYFVLASEGRALLEQYISLTNWWSVLSQRTAYLATTPQLPQASQ
jgi:glutathione S-transferase